MQYAQRFGIRGLEFFNEPDVAGFGLHLAAEQYVAGFRTAEQMIHEMDPEITLLSAAPSGGSIGAGYLRQMMAAGLADIAKKPGVVIPVHVYVANASEFSFLRGHRVWVTETGISDWEKQVGYYQSKIPELEREIRPERIDWYVLWDDTDFSLIRIGGSGGFTGSPLYQHLAGH